MILLEQVKRLLGISDNVQDETVKDIINITQRRLLRKLNGLEAVPPELEYIIVEVSIKRFRRLGSEGMSKKSLEGLSKDFSTDDFKEYEDDIFDFLNPPEIDIEPSRGTVLFY